MMQCDDKDSGNCKIADHKRGDVAVLGTGSVGMKHLEALARIPEITPLGIPVRPERKNELESADYRTVPDLEAAAASGVSRCIIATDSGRHFQDGARALEKGMDILVEKPLCIDAAQARRLLRVAQEHGGGIYVGCVLRFSESLNSFKKLLRKIGSLHSFRVECGSYLPDWKPASHYRRSYSAREGEGGVLRDLIHEIDYTSWILGWPSELQARIKNLGRLGIATEEMADLLWEGVDGCFVSVSLDYLSRPPRRGITACGELGSLQWDGVHQVVILSLADEKIRTFSSKQTGGEMFLDQDTAFLEAQVGHFDSRLASGFDGLRALAICDAARLSSEQGRKQEVPI